MERILKIEIFGEQYKFKAEAEDKNAERVVEFLVNKVSGTRQEMAMPNTDVNKFAKLLLATLNICNEYLDLKDRYDGVLQNVNNRTSKIVKKIDESIK